MPYGDDVSFGHREYDFAARRRGRSRKGQDFPLERIGQAIGNPAEPVPHVGEQEVLPQEGPSGLKVFGMLGQQLHGYGGTQSIIGVAR
jgi:hypothetical protein